MKLGDQDRRVNCIVVTESLVKAAEGKGSDPTYIPAWKRILNVIQAEIDMLPKSH